MSKRADKREKKEALKQQAARRQKIQGVAVKALGAMVVVLALYVFYEGLFGGAPVYPPSEVASGDHVRGNPDAPVTITMYADFQCPSCAREHGIISSAWPRIRDDVRLVFRHFPLDTYPHSFIAARYAEAAAVQDGFWALHDQLFVNQAAWSGVNNPVPMFEGYAEQAGLDLEQLRSDLEDESIREKIIADQRGGVNAGVRSTPTLFFNGEMVENPRSPGQLVEMVSARLEE